ncbi:MAG: hypothetical protein ACTIJ6_09235 [Leucobacter sp.]
MTTSQNHSSEPPADPTKMINQPSLQRSHGMIWIVMGGLFLSMSLVPFGALVLFGSGRSAPVALGVALVLIVIYSALLVTRFVVSEQRRRLRIMAICMLSMAGMALVGIWVCSLIENAGVASLAVAELHTSAHQLGRN